MAAAHAPHLLQDVLVPLLLRPLEPPPGNPLEVTVGQPRRTLPGLQLRLRRRQDHDAVPCPRHWGRPGLRHHHHVLWHVEFPAVRNPVVQALARHEQDAVSRHGNVLDLAANGLHEEAAGRGLLDLLAPQIQRGRHGEQDAEVRVHLERRGALRAGPAGRLTIHVEVLKLLSRPHAAENSGSVASPLVVPFPGAHPPV